MSMFGFAATFVAGVTLGVIIVGIVGSAHDCRESFVCEHCRDIGAHVTNERRPTTKFCNFCVLGQQFEAASTARVDWPTVVRRSLELDA